MQIVQFEKKKMLGNSTTDFLVRIFDFNTETKKVVSFCVVQICFVEGENHEIIKYDAAHGYCHVHKNYQRNSKKIETLFNKEICQETCKECAKDIETNWQKYKKHYFSKKEH
jgi:hypothetical protein